MALFSSLEKRFWKLQAAVLLLPWSGISHIWGEITMGGGIVLCIVGHSNSVSGLYPLELPPLQCENRKKKKCL